MNEEKFNGKEKIYASARPSYPNTLFEYLKNNNIICSDTSVADVGAGTGIFTRQISEYAKRVYAVEPNDGMREQGIKNTASLKNVKFINGTAESTGIKSGSVDIVTVAQAFHWFDRAAFKKECKRILSPGGKVVLVWNNRDESAEIIAKNFEVNKLYCKNFRGSSNGMNFDKDGFNDFFDGEPKVAEFKNNLEYDMSEFIGRSLSSSYAPKDGEPNYQGYVEALKSVFLGCSAGEKAEYPYITKCFIGKV